MEKKIYTVYFNVSVAQTMNVYADNASEAIGKVNELFENGRIFYEVWKDDTYAEESDGNECDKCDADLLEEEWLRI